MGIYNRDIPVADRFQNKGTISLTDLDIGINNYNSTFTNFKAGEIYMDECNTGFLNEGTYYNSGLIECTASQYSGISNRHVLRNTLEGKIELNECHFKQFDSLVITKNFGSITIQDSPVSALNISDGQFINQKAGTIDLSNNNLALVLYAETTFNNYGHIDMYDNQPNGYHAVQYYGQIINESCGSISTDAMFDALPSTSDTIINYGWIVQENESGFDFADSFTNEGVIDYEGTLTYSNNAIQVRSVDEELVENIVIYEALGWGDLDAHTVEGWYTEENGTIIAGTYDDLLNELTPNADGAGLDALWVRITDDNGNCTEDFKVEFITTSSSRGKCKQLWV